MALEIATELLSIIVTLLGSISVTVPLIARFKHKLALTKALIVSIESALADDKITTGEIKTIIRFARELAGTKKI